MKSRRPDNPSPVRDRLRDQGVRPTRSMGQNFLKDAEVAAWITDQLLIEPNDTLLEIGPGLGALTDHLVGRGRRLVLVEKDARLAAGMREKFGGRSDLEVHEADAMEFDLRGLFKEQPLKVIGALPYSCGTEIVRNFTANPSPASRLIFVLQKEVCQRICAKAGSSDYGLLSLRIQSRWEAEYLRTLPPDIFVPRPDVDSAVLALTPRSRSSLPVFDEAVFDKVLRAGFSQRRKMLRNLLPPHPSLAWEQIAAQLGANPMARGQELSLAQWIDLTNLYDRNELKGVAQKHDEIFDVVNEHDEVTGQATRREVHAQKLLHRAIHLFVFNERGEIVLQKRSHLKDAMPEKWDSSAAGHLDAGEDYLSCAVREIHEELGIKTTSERLQRVARIAPSERTGWEWVELFSTTYSGRMTFPSAEIECLQAFPVPAVREWIRARPEDFAEGFLACFEAWESLTEHKIP